MSPTVTTKSFKRKEVAWRQYHLCLAVAEHQIFDGKHFLILGPESGKIWWLKKGTITQIKYHCQWTLLRGEEPKCLRKSDSTTPDVSTCAVLHASKNLARKSWRPGVLIILPGREHLTGGSRSIPTVHPCSLQRGG